MRRIVATVAVLGAAVGAGLGINLALHHRPPNGGPNPGPTAPSATPAAPVDIVPGPGQTFLTGTVTSMTADNAVGPPVNPPFTITIASRGQGNADFTGVAVGGHDVEIFWYGGQPLPVGGTGQLAIDGAGLKVDGSGLTWLLDGAPRTLTTGHYTLGAPVAVGAGGLAQPHQSIAFDAGGRATVQTSGQAQIHLPPASIHLAGPGSVTLHGDLRMQTSASTSTGAVSSVVFGPGSYAIDLVPTGSGDSIRATLQGPISSP